MVASITLPSGSLPDLSNAIFAPGGTDPMASLFDALVAALTQAGDSQAQDASALGAESPVSPAAPASLSPSSPAIQMPGVIFPVADAPKEDPAEAEHSSDH